MTLKDWKILFFSATTLFAFFIYSPLLANLLPPQQQETFLALAILGSQGKTDDYYTENNPEISLNIPVKWHIFIYNHMNEAQQVLVKIKLLTSTDSQPNTTICSPSSSPSIYEIRRILTKNETMIIPFEWEIADIIQNEDYVNISKLRINDYITSAFYPGHKEETLKMIFELWVFNDFTKVFEFGWSDLGEIRCVWNQIQFKIVE
ncbi:MAG: hypothetical protein ACXAB2_00890 [Candidatus Hodarchaeales archaeon]|jgi:hypothetical protein